VPKKSLTSLKVALVHDYLKEWGGAELVLENLSDLFPSSKIYTTLYLPSFLGPHAARLQKKWQGRIQTSFFQKIPLARKLISPLRLLSPLAFLPWDFSAYDLLITSATGAYFPNLIRSRGPGKKPLHLCYCHTPPRYLYGLPTARSLKKYPLLNSLATFINFFLRRLDYLSAQKVDYFIANSQTVADRIHRFYGKKAVIINPPVPLASTKPLNLKRESFYLAGGRLARAKRYDLAIKACSKLNLPLKIFGRDFAGYQKELESLAGPQVEFLGEISNQKKKELFSTCKAYLFTSDNEDFGIVSLEAQACGAPVVASAVGGGGETVLDAQTGVLFPKMTASSVASALRRLQGLKISSSACRAHARNYTPQAFQEKIKNFILSVYS